MPEKGDVKVLDALNLAGGAAGGDTRKAQILHEDKDGKWSKTPINVDDILKKADSKANVALQPNDILYIPPRGRAPFQLGDLLAPVSLLNFLGFRFFGR